MILNCPRCGSYLCPSPLNSHWLNCRRCPFLSDQRTWAAFDSLSNDYIVSLEIEYKSKIISYKHNNIYICSNFNLNRSFIQEVKIAENVFFNPPLYLLSDQEIMNILQPYLIFS